MEHGHRMGGGCFPGPGIVDSSVISILGSDQYRGTKLLSFCPHFTSNLEKIKIHKRFYKAIY